MKAKMPSLSNYAGKKENELKAHLEENKLDLSLMQLDSIPPSYIKQIQALPRATELDLSCNRIHTLPANFFSLAQITHLDLSKNQLKDLPQEIGQMTSLRHLDLSGNQIESLPLGFANLENLRWLDLKDNPLEPSLSVVAGDCLDKKQCTNCAKQVYAYMRALAEAHDKALEKKKKKKDNLDEKKQRKKEEKEKQRREEEKAVKKQDKERRRREYEERRDKEQREVENLGPGGDRMHGDTDSEAEAELRRRNAPRSSATPKPSSFSSIFHFLQRVVTLAFILALVCLAVGVALVAWCQGPRQSSTVCVSVGETLRRRGNLGADFDFGVFCDEAWNRTGTALTLAAIKGEAWYRDNLKPLLEKMMALYAIHVAPLISTAFDKLRTLFLNFCAKASHFLSVYAMPKAMVAWDVFCYYGKIAAVEFTYFWHETLSPFLLTVKDYAIEGLAYLIDHVVNIFDLYIFPGGEKLWVSMADVYKNLQR